jgi:hypothetical protein
LGRKGTGVCISELMSALPLGVSPIEAYALIELRAAGGNKELRGDKRMGAEVLPPSTRVRAMTQETPRSPPRVWGLLRRREDRSGAGKAVIPAAPVRVDDPGGASHVASEG